MKTRKKIPHLKSERSEIDFWSKNDPRVTPIIQRLKKYLSQI
ncbi:hypothetical protein LEP1GSC036_2395 [Leptospira weilii str. 2006001853]|uniref:Uncharacterized protein n=2 Tax=Leptospira weilii TaxID=28184 RepID=A0A828YYF3_9LEPT|nr:hypothetical protein LEP1GSC036_2395 [Leptospira weilii str. 2006001853]EMJ65632.1 hypothetical protein LEP1GSC051_1321 [Leptospira sp. P2653]EMY14887.1 hypothetical protein LEP1GSC043_2906 [Leptospira weilii str. Ecochallenge]